MGHVRREERGRERRSEERERGRREKEQKRRATKKYYSMSIIIQMVKILRIKNKKYMLIIYT